MVSKSQVERIMKKAKAEEKELIGKVKGERMAINDLEKTLDQVLKTQSLKKELIEAQKESALILSQIGIPAPVTPTGTLISTLTSPVASAALLGMLPYAGTSARTKAANLTENQVSRLIPTGAQGKLTVADIQLVLNP